MKNGSVKIFSFVLYSIVLISCGTSNEVLSTTTTNVELSDVKKEKASIFKKLEENNHLPINERIALYHQLKKDSSNDYNFESERELNIYGYSLFQDGKTKEAIEIFKLLVSEFPNSSNPYDSLGEAYLKDGNEELSLLNYEKSVELDPKNTGAIDQINRIKGLELLVTDWGKEIFHFPIHFAPEIPLEGLEEVVFPKNWRKPDSTDFWSYVFVWGLDNKKATTANELEATLKPYFDGLMKVVNDDKEAEMIKTIAHFQKNNSLEDSVDFIGTLTIFDAFATNKPLNLNARVFSNYCEEKGKLILLFQFSPLGFGEPIWDKLRTVKVRSTVCEK
ncbi:MAG: tetratricopeptide (TPR) repeat protein [Crocinitomicaceae bacterium]|jgi:tetratricopeptide (TPR) repeat protein